jgi:RNA polymerase sigma factor (TIGR02999 family)
MLPVGVEPSGLLPENLSTIKIVTDCGLANILKSALPILNPPVNPQLKQVTQLLKQWELGEDDAPARLIPLVYEEIRQLSRNYMQSHTDTPRQNGTLVHQAYLRLVDDESVTRKDRAKFYGVAVRVLRRILVEHGRAQDALKSRGRAQRDGQNGARDLPAKGGALAALNRALENFEDIYPEKSQVVELKFFGGLKTKEISQVLEISVTRVLRDWNFAKLWLYRELNTNGD